MILMLRALVLAALFFVIPRAASGQAPSVLHIKAFLVDAERKATPVPRHALLVSDNPASAPPRRIVTALDGTADVRLRPGNYTVESDRPGRVPRQGLPMDADGGHRRRPRRGPRADGRQRGGRARHARRRRPPQRRWRPTPRSSCLQWQDSVVALWTPTTHASGFVIDAKGLIATNQRVIGTATSVEVQLTPDVKVAASVLAADPARDVAVLWIDPKVVASVRPVPLGCAQAAKPPVVDGQEIFTIGAPLRRAEGHDVRNREPRGAACHRVRLQARVRQRGRTGLHGRRRRGWDHLGRGREG